MVTIRDRRICGTTITGFRNTNLPLILGGYISNDIGNILEDALVIRGSIESDVLSGFIPPPPQISILTLPRCHANTSRCVYEKMHLFSIYKINTSLF